MKTLIRLGTAVIIVAAGIVAFAYSGIYDVAASGSDSGFTNWFLSTTRTESVERRARDINVPDLSDDALALAGINDFNAMCVGCHGAPGIDPEAMGMGLNPPAPDLAMEAAEKSAAELFWVTKNGIKMTGMPAWGATHGDDAIWPVVAFMKKLPELNAGGYQQMLTAAAGHGHHAGNATTAAHGHDETPDHSEQSSTAEIHVHDDGTQHDHGAAATPPPEATPVPHDNSTHEHNND